MKIRGAGAARRRGCREPDIAGSRFAFRCRAGKDPLNVPDTEPRVRSGIVGQIIAAASRTAPLGGSGDQYRASLGPGFPHREFRRRHVLHGGGG